jgi:hypothetical protein
MVAVWFAYASQVVPLQQPLVHDDALQTQAPPEHPWPKPHAAQVAPFLPHSVAVSLPCITHVVPLQQPGHAEPQTQLPFVHVWPAAHELAVHPHLPLVHTWPVPQTAHAPPAVPQVFGPWPWQ